jgi:hypothetical protein
LLSIAKGAENHDQSILRIMIMVTFMPRYKVYY